MVQTRLLPRMMLPPFSALCGSFPDYQHTSSPQDKFSRAVHPQAGTGLQAAPRDLLGCGIGAVLTRDARGGERWVDGFVRDRQTGPMTATDRLSARLQAAVEALSLEPGMRVIEVGGAPGAAAREVARRIAPDGHVLVIDRSAKGVEAIRRTAAAEMAAGLLSVHQAAIEDLGDFTVEVPYDLAFACRVGVLDGRHPEHRAQALENLGRLLTHPPRILVDPR